MKKFVLAIAALCLLLPCAMAAPAAKSLDSYWSDSGKSFPAGGQFSKPMAWAPGQYVVEGSTVKGKRSSVSTTLIVRKDDQGWVIETVSVNKDGKESVGQMCLSGFDTAMSTGDASKIELVWMKSLDKNGKVVVTEGPALTLIKGMMKSSWEKLVVNVSAPVDGGSVAVPAGSFAGTSKIKSSTKVMGQTIETESWFNSAVPVNGVVKSQTTDGKTVNELLAFGTDGKPRIP
jgi:hypothetical protein